MTTLFSVRYTQRCARTIQSAFIRCASTDIDPAAISGIIGAISRKTGVPPEDIHVFGVERLDEVLEAVSDGECHTDGKATAVDASEGAAGGESAGGKPATDTRPSRSGGGSGSGSGSVPTRPAARR